GNTRMKTSRNCSSLRPTWRTSFSLALPKRKKFFVRILVQLSFAATVLCCETMSRRQKVKARGKTKRFIKCPRLTRESEGPRDGRIIGLRPVDLQPGFGRASEEYRRVEKLRRAAEHASDCYCLNCVAI